MRQFTEKERRAFENICRFSTQSALKTITNILKTKYNELISTPAYTMAIGDIPVVLIAHADTVFKIPPKDFFYDTEKNVIWSPDGMGADDRAGIFAITQILKTEYRPSIIITTGEETGGIGAHKLATKYPIFPGEAPKFLIQLDRRGSNDSVYYDCGNEEFEKYINNFGFITNWGTFTDISILAPVWGCAAVNLSIGYREEHQEIEHLYVGEMFETIRKVENILADVVAHPEMEAFEYIDAMPYSYWVNGAYKGWDYWDEDEEDTYPMPAKKIPSNPNNFICAWCGCEEPRENMLQVHMNSISEPIELCTACYSKCYTSIDWCSKCQKAWYLDYNDVNEKYEATVKQNKPFKYICPRCKNDNGGKYGKYRGIIPSRSKSNRKNKQFNSKLYY